MGEDWKCCGGTAWSAADDILQLRIGDGEHGRRTEIRNERGRGARCSGRRGQAATARATGLDDGVGGGLDGGLDLTERGWMMWACDDSKARAGGESVPGDFDVSTQNQESSNQVRNQDARN